MATISALAGRGETKVSNASKHVARKEKILLNMA
jgi:hypothetical protein